MKIFFAVLSVLLCGSALATEPQKYYEIENYYYEEPGLMDKTSAPLFFGGGLRSYAIDKKAAPSFFYNMRVGYGRTDYSGTGTTADDPTYRFQGEGGLIVQYGTMKVFGGLGYRWLYDDWGGKISSTGGYSYDRQSRYWYLPMGVMVEDDKGSSWKFQYNYFLEGEQTSYLTDISGYLNDLVNTQESGSGFEIEYQHDESWAIFLRAWNVNDSDVQLIRTTSGNSYGYEPKNETTEMGLTVFFR